ncbi:DUF167 domain-containing protein [Micromonospora sp. Llam7]|uniref:DUF167 domain-containing protein n=1 Tax=Micromonospora tarapacensis TaxID=2835305 RepID=UPI001C83D93A|nr:DUF167 domain-containing protein [Micromonospora tarapacensis]MBX7264678.1 DUF167 domain-containing protein [Micromonospora tarapacensis]
MADALTVAVRVKPGASRARVGGRFDGPHGPALVIAVSPPAVDGRATEAARRALAAALGVRPAAVSLRTGSASRDKLFLITPAPPDLVGRLSRLRDGNEPAG